MTLYFSTFLIFQNWNT